MTERLAGALCALLLAGCGGSALAPVSGSDGTGAEHPIGGEHVVEAGETLYSIAWRYGFDYRQLARWNGIYEPYTIYPGEVMALGPRAGGAPPRPRPAPPAAPVAETAPAVAAAAPAQTASAPPATGRGSEPSATESAAKGKTAAAAPAPRPRKSARKTPSHPPKWQWPARGKIIGAFGRSGRKGIDISGAAGEPVRAAADGKVVYSGSGLIGYGRLIILKHDKRYLSAYAHNQEIMVREGDTVTAGQRIASMGRSGTDRIKLHFEIRRDGKPVDPLRYLSR